MHVAQVISLSVVSPTQGMMYHNMHGSGGCGWIGQVRYLRAWYSSIRLGGRAWVILSKPSWMKLLLGPSSAVVTPPTTSDIRRTNHAAIWGRLLLTSLSSFMIHPSRS